MEILTCKSAHSQFQLRQFNFVICHLSFVI